MKQLQNGMQNTTKCWCDPKEIKYERLYKWKFQGFSPVIFRRGCTSWEWSKPTCLWNSFCRSAIKSYTKMPKRLGESRMLASFWLSVIQWTLMLQITSSSQCILNFSRRALLSQQGVLVDTSMHLRTRPPPLPQTQQDPHQQQQQQHHPPPPPPPPHHHHRHH